MFTITGAIPINISSNRECNVSREIGRTAVKRPRQTRLGLVSKPVSETCDYH